MVTRTKTREISHEKSIFPQSFSIIKPAEVTELSTSQTIEFKTSPPLKLRNIELGKSLLHVLNYQWDETRRKWYAERTAEGTEVSTVKAYKPDSDTFEYLQLDADKYLKVSDIDLQDDSIKGLLRSIGDAGGTPTNNTGQTVLARLKNQYDRLLDIYTALTNFSNSSITRSIGDASSSPTNKTGKTVLKLLDEIRVLLGGDGYILLAEWSITASGSQSSAYIDIKVSHLDRITVICYPMEAGDIYLDWSWNGTSYLYQDTWALTITTLLEQTVNIKAPYLRVTVSNTGASETYFRVLVKYTTT